MTKKNRNKAKAKRFGEGSVKSQVSAATYGVGNAFGSFGGSGVYGAPDPSEPPRGTNARGQKELLVVDGYNIIHATAKYERLIYDSGKSPYATDRYDSARMALIADVAAFAQGSYEAVIVFDGAGNVNPDRPNLPQAGIRIEYSPTGVSADTVIQRLCTEARESGRACSVVTSDGTIQATVMGKGVTRISARMLVEEMDQIDREIERVQEEAPNMKLTLGSRLSPEAAAKLAGLRAKL
ncbi:YacP-like NYN domain protein [Collinsella sp. AK_207A]|uniref:NYN domain-containing protein n=1 Tax=Collinsella sp. AK_207A TaxID=2650472 RepID=UPI0012605A8C|nr:NYN domain-containing protein [Collinsella sp. AK_207A]VWM02827.1 YacP-like NYN domain protein [Collinsella sp. AK_207A]